MLAFVGLIYSIGMEIEFLSADNNYTDNTMLVYYWDAKTDKGIDTHADFMMLGY